MRQRIALLALGALLAMRCPARAGDAEKEPTDYDLVDEAMDALRDYENAQTDEQAAKAEKRFEDANQRELDLQRDKFERVLER